MPNTIRSQSALSVLIRSINDLMKNPYLTNLVHYLYDNMMISIPLDQVFIVNISRAFLYTFLQSSVFCLTIVILSIAVLAWLAKLYLYAFLVFLSSNLIVWILIFFYNCNIFSLFTPFIGF